MENDLLMLVWLGSMLFNTVYISALCGKGRIKNLLTLALAYSLGIALAPLVFISLAVIIVSEWLS